MRSGLSRPARRVERGCSPPPAAKHATLVSSEPAANSRLTSSPRSREARVQRAGRRQAGESIARPGYPERRSCSGLVPIRGTCTPSSLRSTRSAPGRYKVEWRVVSADGHPVDGTFTFAVRRYDVRQASRRLRPSPAGAEPEPRGGIRRRLGAGGVRRAASSPPCSAALALGDPDGDGAACCCFSATADLTRHSRRRGGCAAPSRSLSVAAPVLLGGHLVTWLINTSPDHHVRHRVGRRQRSARPSDRSSCGGLASPLLALWAWWLARRPGSRSRSRRPRWP